MKIHPNHQINEMLKNGTAKIIDYKFIPCRVQNVDLNAFMGSSYSGRSSEGNMGYSGDIGTALRTPPVTHLSVPPAAARPRLAPVTRTPVSSMTAQPKAEPVFPPSVPPEDAQPEAAQPEDAQPEAAQPEDAQPEDAQPEDAQPEDAQPEDAQPEDAQPEDAQPEDAQPEDAQPEDAQPEDAQPEDAQPEDAQKTAVLPVSVHPAPVAARKPKASPPDVSVRVMQPEDAPGGLIAEIHMAGEPIGPALEMLSGLAFSSGIWGSAAAVTGQAQAADPVEDSSYPPYISFITFNRLGLTIRNLTNLLDSSENFELNIIDSNSKDNSWDYIRSLTDPRIKSRIRFDVNCGPIYAVNFALSRRKPYQYFIVVDSDTYIKTKNWIARFMEVFNAFPEVGLLGLMRDNPYPRYLPPIIPRVSGPLAYLQLLNADINAQMDFIPGQLQCLRPGLIRQTGYWSEENGFGDAELSPRVVHYTGYTAGFITTIEIDMTQSLTCGDCMGKAFCTLNRSLSDCFSLCRLHNKNESFVAKNTWKFTQSFQELAEGRRTAYCASIHDPASRLTHPYNSDWAYDNFNHYILNAN